MHASTPMKSATSTSEATTAAPSGAAAQRAPSLSEIAASMKSQAPGKWERMREQSIATSETAALASLHTPTTIQGHSNSVNPQAPILMSSDSSGARPVQQTVLQTAHMTPSESTTTTSDVCASFGSSNADSPGSFLQATRLRLTARLAAAAPAPLLSRSHSTNAIVQSSECSAISNGAYASSALPANGAAGPGSSVPSLSDLQSTLARRSSVSATTSQSLPARGLPSLEAIEKRFAQKKEKGRDKDASSSSSSAKVASSANPTNGILYVGNVGKINISAGKHVHVTAVKVEPPTPSDASKENVDLKTGVDTSQSTNAAIIKPDSVAKSEASSSTSRTESSDPLAIPTDVNSSLDKKGTRQTEHPLQHRWTLYYDSRNAKKSTPAAAPATPTSAGHPNGNATGQQQYEAGLSTLAAVDTVESFCRLFNWLKKPSKLGVNENMHLFKQDILPMWEDENNKQGGKWTVCLDPKILNVRNLLDKMWMYICFALIGEDFEEKNDLVCGAVVSVRPRAFRFQVWLRDKQDVQSINLIGKNLVRILELESPSNGARLPGVSLDFSSHLKPGPAAQKFLHIPATPVPAPSTAFQAHSGSSSNGTPARGISSSGSITPVPSASRTPAAFGMTGNARGSSGLSRAVSMNAIASKLASGSLPEQISSNGSINWRERLGQGSRKSSLAT